MGLQYRKARVVLNYRETKPQMFKLVQLTYPAVTTEQLIKWNHIQNPSVLTVGQQLKIKF